MDGIINFYSFLYGKMAEIWKFLARERMIPFFFPRGSTAGFNLLWLFTQLLGLIALVLVLSIFSKSSEVIIKNALDNFWKNIITGFGIFFIAPLAAIAVFITIIGILPGIIIFFAYGFLAALSIVYAGMAFGSAVFKVISGSKMAETSWYSATVGAISLFIIGLIPVVGWIIYLLFFIISLGSASQYYFNRLSLK